MGARADIYMVHDLQLLAGKLLNGMWCLYRHEHLGEDNDLDNWKATFEKQCAAVGVVVEFFDIPKKDLTLAYNLGAGPTFEEVVEGVSAIDYYRFTEKEIGTEMQVRT